MEPDDNTITITSMDGTTDTITIDLSDTYTTTLNTLSMSDYTVDTIDISSITTSGDFEINWDSIGTVDYNPVMFEDSMPEPQDLKRMCEEYPALEKVYENFKTVYKMVEQDWRGKQDSDEDTLF
jgi:hypothetical protein